MVFTIPKRAHALAASPLMALICLLASAIVARPLRAQQSCDDFNECTVTDACDASGNCKGTNKPNGTPCTSSATVGDCVVSATCQNGLCRPSSTKPIGTPCTNPLLGPCMTNATCQLAGFCFGDLKECQDDGNLCTEEFCNPQSGECQSIPKDCNDDCSTAQCNPDTGECTNIQNRQDGTTCDDFNDCTSNDSCSGGECRGSTTPGATATRTPTGLTAFTPTATATHPPATPTPSTTATRTLGVLPTATETGRATVTATAVIAPPAGSCVGDCGGNGDVTVDEIIKGVNIALGNLPLGDCIALDADGNGDVTINEIIQAVGNALSGCPTPPPTHTPTVEPTATSTTPPSATPSPTRTFEPTATPTTAAPTATLTATLSPTRTATATTTLQGTRTPTITASASPTASATETMVPTATQTVPPTATHTVLETATPTPSSTATPTLPVTGTPTMTASAAPTASATATVEPTATPSPSETPESSPTPTVTPTESPTPTVTQTSGPSIPQRAAGTIQSSTSALLVVPNILSAILGHTGGGIGSGSAAGLIDLPFQCPAGGSGQVSCNQSFFPVLGPPAYTITLTNCMVTGTAGTTLTFDGTVLANGKQGDSCLSIPANLSVTIPNLTVTAQGTNGMTTATFTDVSGSVTLSGASQSCTYNTVSFNLVGTMSVEFKDAMGAPLGSTQVGFGQGSSIEVKVSQYGADCVPTVYNTTVQGAITFTSGSNSFAATFTDYMLHDDATSGNNLITVSGGIASACLGAPVQLSTAADLLVLGAAPCPRAGEVVIASGGTSDLVRYTNGGGVEIDVGNNMSVDKTFDTCLDPLLFQCPST